eukprot:m.236158 g.236158  ORF g.236158 m.236158 type:complete len:90 (+) comp15772_c0_seq3:124-393(+)
MPCVVLQRAWEINLEVRPCDNTNPNPMTFHGICGPHALWMLALVTSCGASCAEAPDPLGRLHFLVQKTVAQEWPFQVVSGTESFSATAL